jgi:hypothetical protein
MIKAEKNSAFRNVGECLYRLNGWYYARFKRNGKEIKQSLRTQGYTTAKRELKRVMEEQGQLDPSLAKLTLARLCDRYLETLSGLRREGLTGLANIHRCLLPAAARNAFRHDARQQPRSCADHCR